MPDGSPLRRDVGTTTKIAREAVKKVYQHVSSPKDTAFLAQRIALAERFRRLYGSEQGDDPNALPFFIGVFDTVAALGSRILTAALLTSAALVILAASYVQSFFLFPFLPTFAWSIGIVAVAVMVGYIATHLKYAPGLKDHPLLATVHLAAPKMQFYDLHLNNGVWYARHAMSIDENRADFARVPWGGVHNTGPERPDEYPDWLQQVWFAGNHSDVGGSYPENEARLSDIALGWMTHAAKNLPDGATADGYGIKIDEREPGWFGGRFKWTEGLREIQPEAILHSSVLKRFAAKDGVQHYYETAPYRPKNLSEHLKLKSFYDAVTPTEPPSSPASR